MQPYRAHRSRRRRHQRRCSPPPDGLELKKPSQANSCTQPAVPIGPPGGAPRAPPQLSSASSPSTFAHARNDRAAIRALPSSDTSSRRRTRRSRLCGNRGPTNVRANSAASSSVRTVTSRARRRGGSNTKFVMHRKLASHNRSSGGAVWRESFAPWLNGSYGVLNPGGTSHSFSCPHLSIMASGHVNRTKRPNTWLHRPACNVKISLANSEPSTHALRDRHRRPPASIY
jgi:hypothetical protein